MSNTIVVPLAIFWSKKHLTQSFLESVEGNLIQFFVKAITSISSAFWPKVDQKSYLKNGGQIQGQQPEGNTQIKTWQALPYTSHTTLSPSWPWWWLGWRIWGTWPRVTWGIYPQLPGTPSASLSPACTWFSIESVINIYIYKKNTNISKYSIFLETKFVFVVKDGQI